MLQRLLIMEHLTGFNKLQMLNIVNVKNLQLK